ncbi:MAG: phosphopantetheine-binding protein, partial [Acidobacteriota bacterium]
GEIETALGQLDGVSAAAVVLQEDGAGSKRLVAYVVPTAEAPKVTDLRDALGRSMPAFLVPTAFQFLDSIPLTPNGKVDRRALPAFEFQRAGRSEEVVEPGTALEKVLARLWRENLGAEAVGLGDSFFELGGHSLLATRVFNDMAEELDLDLPLQLIFQAPTLGDFARAVETELRATPDGEETLQLLDDLEALNDDQRAALLDEGPDGGTDSDIQAARGG